MSISSENFLVNKLGVAEALGVGVADDKTVMTSRQPTKPPKWFGAKKSKTDS